MRWNRRQGLILLPLLLCTSLAHAGVQLVVDGVDDNLKGAITSTVELAQYANRDVTEAQARRLYERAHNQVTLALQPYGYYEPSVDGDIKQVGKDWQVTLHVDRKSVV